MASSYIVKYQVVEGKNPVKIEMGTPVFLGKHCPHRISKSGSCGHVISIAENGITIYSPGYTGECKEYIKVIDEIGSEHVTIFNSGCLYVMDSSIVPEMVSML